MSDALFALLRSNLAGAVAVVLALLLRRPVRRLFGARIAYGLWALVPMSAFAMLAPARVITVARPALVATSAPGASHFAGGAGSAPSFEPAGIGLIVWAAGVLAAILWLVWRQVQFGHAMRDGRAGPAVVGVLRPRIVVPDDFAQRYTPREQGVVIAHEATHIARQDSRINAVVSLARCLAWFNPFAHLMAGALRIDQELACDAQVIADHPAARRSYAEAMLKAQLAGRPLPLGCYWPSQAPHPLAERIDLLSRPAPGYAMRALGATMVILAAIVGAAGAWATRPPRIVIAAQLPPRVAPAAQTVTPPAAAPVASPAPAPEVSRAELVQISATPTPDPVAQDLPPVAAPETKGEDGLSRRLLPPDLFGGRRIGALASRSSVEPGLAVRVVANMVDPEGNSLTTDLTSFGSQSRYRIGSIDRHASRFKLFTTVEQHGERLLVTAGLTPSLEPMRTGSIELASGETGTIKLPNGQLVTVTPTIRAETPEEVAEGQGRTRIDVYRVPHPSWS